MTGALLIYGANGYTGELTARFAAERKQQATPEGYTLTALTSLEIAKRALAGEVEKGFSTPAKLLGPDFILGFEAVRRRDDLA